MAHIALGIGNVQLTLKGVHLGANVGAVGNACGLANTLLTKQLALLDYVTGHCCQTLDLRNLGLGHAFLTCYVQHVLVCHELFHRIHNGFAGRLRLQLRLTCGHLFLAHGLELFGDFFADKGALTGRQPGQRRLGLNEQPGLVRVLH